MPTIVGPALLAARSYWKLELPPVHAVVGDLILPGLNILAGPFKIGKSWLVMQMCRSVATGSRFFNRETAQGDAIYYALEDGERRLQGRLKKQGIEADGLDRLHFGTYLPRIYEGCLDELEAKLDDLPDTKLVVIDTLARIRPTRHGNGTAYDVDSELGDYLQRFALEHDVALVMVTHLRKMPSLDVFETINGSVGLPGTAVSVIVLKRDRGQADGVLHVTSRDFEEREDALRFCGATGTWTLLGDAAEFRLSEQRRLILDAVCELGVVGPRAVADHLGDRVKLNTVRQLMPKMVTDGILESEGRGKYKVPGPAPVASKLHDKPVADVADVAEEGGVED